MDVYKVNHEGALLFEQPFIKVPFEQFRKIFKTSQRHIERDFTALQKDAADLAKKNPQGDDALKQLDAMINKVQGLKRKLSELHENSNAPAQASMRRRLDHLTDFEKLVSTEQPEFNAWSDTRLNRWLVDWALRNGREETAKAVAKNSDIENLVDIDLFSDIHRIEEALKKHSCTEALTWCSQNKTALAKLKSPLEFDLRLQEYIELARVGKSQEAVAYANKHFSAYLGTHPNEVTRCMGLLAYGPDTRSTVYKRLYDPSRWNSLIRSFRQAAYSLHSLPTEPFLNLALYAGLAALKLPSCYCGHDPNIDCPICDSAGLGKLAEEVPYSHHSNSTIVCRISGKIMNEDNPPLAFPNGYVYSMEALHEMSIRSNGVVTCPRSGHVCKYHELRKVFIT